MESAAAKFCVLPRHRFRSPARRRNYQSRTRQWSHALLPKLIVQSRQIALNEFIPSLHGSRQVVAIVGVGGLHGRRRRGVLSVNRGRKCGELTVEKSKVRLWLDASPRATSTSVRSLYLDGFLIELLERCHGDAGIRFLLEFLLCIGH